MAVARLRFNFSAERLGEPSEKKSVTVAVAGSQWQK